MSDQGEHGRFIAFGAIAVAMALVAWLWNSTMRTIDGDLQRAMDSAQAHQAGLARLLAGTLSAGMIAGTSRQVTDTLLTLQGVALGTGGEITFVDPAGNELLSVTGAGSARPAGRSSIGRMLDVPAHAPRTFVASDGSGVQRIVAVAPGPSGDYAVAVSRSVSDALVGHKEVRRNMLGWTLLATLAALAGTTLLVRRMARLGRTIGLLKRTEASRDELIAELKAERDRVHSLAYFDQLTGLANRGFFRAMAVERLAGSRRRRCRAAIAFVDLDRFKAINDSFGHAVGDRLLAEVARRLRSVLRQSDSIARFGGDEFVIQLTDVEEVEQLNAVLGKVIDAVSEPVRIDDHDLQVNASIGVAVFPQDGESIDELLRNADAAMYEAKRTGRGNYRFFDAELNARVLRITHLENRFRAAIENGEFEIHYQPRLDTRGYGIVSLEALVRWRHPEYGLVFPGDFIPLAEETGFIVELGEVVVGQVCAQIAVWRAEGYRVPRIAINASAKQLRDDGFLHLIRWNVERRGIAYEDLEIEVTESCVMDDPEMSAAILERLAALGIKISLDDYGTGYSSLSCIKRLPLSAIKIDRSFVRDIGVDPNDDVIVASTISMSHGLGLRVVAEGVETRSQLIRLRVLGCEEVQGYLFSRPVPADEVARMLARGTCAPRQESEAA